METNITEDLSMVTLEPSEPGSKCVICPGHGRMDPNDARVVAKCGEYRVPVCNNPDCLIVSQRRAKLYGLPYVVKPASLPF